MGLKIGVDVQNDDKSWKLSHKMVEMVRQKHIKQVLKRAEDQSHGESPHINKARRKVRGRGGVEQEGAGGRRGRLDRQNLEMLLSEAGL